MNRSLPGILLIGVLLFPFVVGQCRTASPVENGRKGTETGRENGGQTATEKKDQEPGDRPGKKTGETGEETTSGFVEEQPEFPLETDDPFFRNVAESGEVFRVLIADGNYQVRQVSNEKFIRRKRDPNGDREQLSSYQKFANHYNFMDFVFHGTLEVRLNPHSGNIELIKYIPGKTPRAAQVTMIFKNDLARYSFSFPQNSVVVRSFTVTYEWRIKKRAGLTPEEARRELIEFLKTEKRE